jgi:hypothetical protein
MKPGFIDKIQDFKPKTDDVMEGNLGFLWGKDAIVSCM